MDIIVNGKTKNLDQSPTLQAYIEQICPYPNRVIAEVNEKIIKREKWSSVTLKDGDQIELVTMVGGG